VSVRPCSHENSQRKAVKLITISDGSIIQNALDEARKIHCEIAEAVATALQIPMDAVFRTARYIGGSRSVVARSQTARMINGISECAGAKRTVGAQLGLG
jgi:hypothetical protein